MLYTFFRAYCVLVGREYSIKINDGKIKRGKCLQKKAEYKWISLPLLRKDVHVQQFIIGGKTTGAKTSGLKTWNS